MTKTTMTKATTRLAMIALLAGLSTAPATAQDRDPLVIPRLSGPVTLDGRVREAAWDRIPPLELTMYLPTFQGEPTETTEIRVAHDGEHLYLSCRCLDSDPGGIRVNSLYRDRWSGDDAFAVFVDPFNDNENALWFTTTPAGIRVEHALSNDGGTFNTSWNTFWEARSTVTDRGWFSEIRIPFSSLGFQAEDGRVEMGLTVTRLVARKNERVTFPAIDPRYQFRQPSQARDVVLRGVSASTPLYFTPYSLAGLDRQVVLPDGAGRWETEQRTTGELGLDLKVNLTSNLTLDLTANTDFAQVEADDQQINLGRFPLFFPEKRRFFQERAGIFDFQTGAGGRLFHSRRIGLDRARQPVPILGGARLVGRLDEWDLGALTMQTEATPTSPSENFAVARLRRRVLNPYSYVGGIVTSRLDDEGGRNVVYGLDGVLRIVGDDYLQIQWAQSFDRAVTEEHAPGPWDASQLAVHLERRTSRGLQYNARWVRSGPHYTPDLGFLPRRDFTHVGGFAQYHWFQPEGSSLRKLLPGFTAVGTFRNGDGTLESASIRHWWTFELKSGDRGWIEPEWFLEDVTEPFELADGVVVPAGRHAFADLWLNYTMTSGRLLRTGVDTRIGSFYDGWRAQATLSPTWNASEHLELGGEYQVNLIRFPDRGERLDTHLARLRIRSALDARLSVNGLVQYSSAGDRMGVNLRIRYNFREGNDLWLVYNEGLNTDRSPLEPGQPRQPLSRSRSLIIKYTHTLAM